MEQVALMSRLRAACQNAEGVDWDWKDTDVQLARKLMDKNKEAWEGFSAKYDMVFNYEAGLFLDIKEIASVIVAARESKDPKVLADVAELERLLGLKE